MTSYTKLAIGFLVFIGIGAFIMGFKAGKNRLQQEDDYYTIRYNPAIFHNADSLMYYALCAVNDEDSDALGITGLAPFLFLDDPAARDTLPLVTPRLGALLLQRSADSDCDRAQHVIDCLKHQGLWDAVAPASDAAMPVLEYISPLYYNRDSILNVAERAYIGDDRDALYLMAIMASAKNLGYLPDSIYTVSIDEAKCMVYRAAQLGHPRAIRLVQYLIDTDQWHLPLNNE